MFYLGTKPRNMPRKLLVNVILGSIFWTKEDKSCVERISQIRVKKQTWSWADSTSNSWLQIRDLWLKRRVGKDLGDLLVCSMSQPPILETQQNISWPYHVTSKICMVRTLSGELCSTVSLWVQERLFPVLFCSKLICLNAQEIKKPDFSLYSCN